MKRTMTHPWWIGLLGLVWFGLSGEGQAWENPMVRVSNLKLNFQVELKVAPPNGRPTAPWYTYFPNDPRMLPSPQASPFPPWPGTFPPPGLPPVPMKVAPKQAQANVPSGPMLTQAWSNQPNYGLSLQPVGYVPAQAPSYWYSNR